jgi:predicted metal-dependent phosphoesterase TrpH
MPADLHIHTTYSDGTCSPKEIFSLATKAGLNVISITDHDTVAALQESVALAEEHKIEFIPGIEFTCEVPKTEVHILGYFIDWKEPSFQGIVKKIQGSREQRIYKFAEKLKMLGIELNPEEVFELAGHRFPGRPHIARVLVKTGQVRTIKEAFDRFLDFRAPAYVSHYKLTPEQAISLILKNKGIPVYAHPASTKADDIIPQLVSAGLRGIEVYYPSHSPSETNHYHNIAKKYGLLITGGSDFHGTGTGREISLGKIYLKDKYVKELKKAYEYICRN